MLAERKTWKPHFSIVFTGLFAGGLGALALTLYVAAEGVLDTLTVEDGVVEYTTALCYLIAATLFAWLVLRGRWGRGWFLLLAVGFFLVMGEEISWGQRLLGFSTPSAIEQSNVQQELTLHNLEGLQDNARLLGVVLFTLLYLALPIARGRDNELSKLIVRLRIPIPPMSCAVLALLGLGFMAVPRIQGAIVFSLDEVGELYLALAAAVFGLSQWSEVRQGRATLNPPPVPPAASARETA